jgi:hypothetical protein
VKKIVPVFWAFLLLFLLIACEKESNKSINGGELRYLNSKLGGCNVPENKNLKAERLASHDTVIFSAGNDSLNIFAGVNYICCTPFAGEVSVSNDSILISLNDTCNTVTSPCYCHCMCYYTWDFKFSGMEDKDYFYKVILTGEWNGGSEVVMEGIFNPGNSD